MEFPIFNTKELSNGKNYDLNDPAERREYFEVKLGSKLDELKEYLDSNTFVAFLLAKKSAGKGTYSKLFQEVVGEDRSAVVSVGDLVRDTHKQIEDSKREEKRLVEYFEKNLRGFITPKEAVDTLTGRSQDKLLPTEVILTLVKRKIEEIGRKAIFIDGLPRDHDQISYSLYFREIINFRDDPDFFILIDVPMSVIDERMKYRKICPICKTSRNIKLLPTKFVEYDDKNKEFYLVCDNSACKGFGKKKMVSKEGDEHGIKLIKERLDRDQELINLATKLQGIPKVYLRNSIPVSKSKKFAEDYEITPEYEYKLVKNKDVEHGQEVKVIEKPWTIKDDSKVVSHSLLAAPVAVSMISQIHDVLFGKSS